MELRNFQKRIIAQSDYFLTDHQMHIVAPPGAGKTILGVEMIKKVKHPTLILVPSLILKNQWLTVLEQNFDSSQLSASLSTSQFITVTTYQDFYSTTENFLNNLNAKFIILDEAHHLKKAWATKLLQFKENKELTFLSLTATPPYDASLSEWQTYLELNGNIDEEIPASELIKDNILAPYQDYLYLIPILKENQRQLEDYLAKNKAITKELFTSQEIALALVRSEFIAQPLEHSTFIFENLPLYLSTLAYLANQGFQLNQEHWKIIGLEKRKQKVLVPEPDLQNLDVILTYLYEFYPELKIFSFLKKNHWLDETGLTLFPAYQPTIKTTHAPLVKDAIEHIVVKEEAFLGAELCCVIFLDFIKEKALHNHDDFLDLGVVPVFIRLEKLLRDDTEIAAICGSFLIISESMLAQEKELSALDFEDVLTVPNYKKINLTETNRAILTKHVTDLLNQKRINILVGTVSFLGEGWNCPNINTIILGNSASSFVQTQQLRGRGLRIGDVNQLTNIWHIAPVYQNIPSAEQPELQRVMKRLSFIEGLDLIAEPMITSDIERFDIPIVFDNQRINARISDNFDNAEKRDYFFEQWQSALYKGSQLDMSISLKNQLDPIKMIGINPYLGEEFKENFFNQFNWWFFPKLRKRRKWRRYCKVLTKIMMALHQLLLEEDNLSQQENLILDWNENSFNCTIQSDRYYIKSYFNRLSLEILSEIDNPRYLLKVEQHYFTVPKRFAINREQADLYLKYVKSELPKAKLFYTKNLKGRKELMNAYFSQEKKEVLQRKVWR